MNRHVCRIHLHLPVALTNRVILLVLLFFETLMGEVAHAEQGKYIGVLPGEFLDPSGVAVSPSALYVVDSGNSQIQKFASNGQKLIDPKWGGERVSAAGLSSSMRPPGSP